MVGLVMLAGLSYFLCDVFAVDLANPRSTAHLHDIVVACK